MPRWQQLTEFLRASDQSEITVTYDQIEEIIGGPLPVSASRWRPQMWSNTNGNGYAVRWREAGYRTDLARLAGNQVRFVRARASVAADSALAVSEEGPPAGDSLTDGRIQPPSGTAPVDVSGRADVALVGCVKTKRAQPMPAKDLYASPLWERRRRYAEGAGVPWLILSAEHGVVHPDAVLAPYDRYLTEQPHEYRARWARRVVHQLRGRFGSLRGMVFELHAGNSYADPLEPLLRAELAELRRPLAGLRQGEQLRWYDQRVDAASDAPIRSPSGADSEPPTSPLLSPSTGLSRRLTEAFVNGDLDLSARPDAPSPGWHSMPEVRAVETLTARGATPAQVRTFLTLIAAMDRARDADRLWDAGAALFVDEPGVFSPSEVVARSLTALSDALRRSSVSQRHGQDGYAWRIICESLLEPSAIRHVIDTGTGDTGTLLVVVRSTSPDGTPKYPLLSGEKIATMWVRLLAHPGGAHIAGLEALPVAVDVQVRKITEYLGVAETMGMDLETARPLIQAAWRRHVEEHGAAGPETIRGTGGALDPALWFYAKWGCTTCERQGRRRPISALCSGCRFDSVVGPTL
jgi:hypothetical protein